MSRSNLLPALTFKAVIALAVAAGFVGCTGATPSQAAKELGLQKADTPAAAEGTTPATTPAATAAPATPVPPKPVPTELPAVVARVNGQDITKADFERALRSIEQRAGGPVPEQRRAEIYRGLLEQLVRLQLLKQEAAARKVTVPDADVDKRLAEIQQQFPSEDVFKQMLATQKITLEKFRADQRQDLVVAKMLADALKDKVAATPEQIADFYKNNPDRFKQGERVRASHILITVPQGADGITKDKARETAEGLLKKVKAGGDFAALAKENSQDPGSAVQGGDLGYFQPGQMVGPFDEVAFKLPPGAVSDLVETQFGFHIIKVVDKQAGRTVPLEEVRPQLTQFLENQNRQRESAAFVSALRAKGKIEILI
jgi:peptidyl-prolyl cis-trans isomerase C